jgi:hypothetical protein
MKTISLAVAIATAILTTPAFAQKPGNKPMDLAQVAAQPAKKAPVEQKACFAVMHFCNNN